MAQSHKTAPDPLQMSVASPGYSSRFWPTGYRMQTPMMFSLDFKVSCKSRLFLVLLTDWLYTGGSQDPSSGSINLLVWLTEFRETFHLLDYQFIIKEYNSSIARWKWCTGQGHKLPCAQSTPLPPNLHLFTNLGTQSTGSPWYPVHWLFMEASIQRHVWLNHLPLAIEHKL